MKADIHPTYYKKVVAKCACGATYEVGSTMESITTEICAACHPFYTGKQKILDTAGQVDKFLAKVQKAAKAKAKSKASESKEEDSSAELLASADSPQAELVETAVVTEEVTAESEPEVKVKKEVKAAPKKAAAKKPAAKKAPAKTAKKVTKKKTSKK